VGEVDVMCYCNVTWTAVWPYVELTLPRYRSRICISRKAFVALSNHLYSPNGLFKFHPAHLKHICGFWKSIDSSDMLRYKNWQAMYSNAMRPRNNVAALSQLSCCC
jgi:hypothetical protein